VKKALLCTAALGLAALLVWPQPAPAQKKEYIQLQRDVALLQEQVRDLQRSHEEKSALLKTLLEQALDSVNRMQTSVANLEQSVREAQANTNARVDSLGTQVQALGDGVDELRARLAEISAQVAETRSVLESVDARLAAPGGTEAATTAQGGPPSGAPSATPAAPPSADVLYSTALRDFIGGNYELARQEFTDYLNYYGRTQLAGNAQFYIGETFYRQGDYDRAIAEYDKVLGSYPNSYKIAAASLKKGYALLELDKREDGVRILRDLIQKFPGSEEAKWARARLERLGVSVPE
jgi:tol-pal system protein YbgF